MLRGLMRTTNGSVDQLNQMSFEDFLKKFNEEYNTCISLHIRGVKDHKAYPFNLFNKYLESKHKEELFKLFDKSETIRELFNPYIIKLFLEYGLDVNTADNKGNTLLHLAILHRTLGFTSKLELVNHLLPLALDINLQNKEGQTPIHLICSEYFSLENSVILEKLLPNKPNLNLKDKKNQTALLVACKNTKVGFIKMLLCLEPDLELPDLEGNTALAFLMRKGEFNGAALLAKAGAKFDNVKPKYVKNFLNCCCENGEYDMIEIFAKNKYDFAALYSLIEGSEHLMTKLIVKIYRIFKGEYIEPVKHEVPSGIIHHLADIIKILTTTMKIDLSKVDLIKLNDNLPNNLTKEIFKHINESLLQIIKFQFTKEELKILCEKDTPRDYSNEELTKLIIKFATILELSGNFDKALEYYKFIDHSRKIKSLLMEALKSNPDDPKLNEELAIQYVHERNFKEAYKYFLNAKLFAANKQEIYNEMQLFKNAEGKQQLFEKLEKRFEHSHDTSYMTKMPGDIYAQIQIDFLFEGDL